MRNKIKIGLAIISVLCLVFTTGVFADEPEAFTPDEEDYGAVLLAEGGEEDNGGEEDPGSGEEAAEHIHSLICVGEVAPAFGKEGSKAHYACEGCELLFEDENAETVIAPESIVIPKLSLTQRNITVANAADGVTVKWDADPAAEQYRIYRKVPGGSWDRLATISATNLSYKDTKAESGSSYIYTVRSMNGSTLGPYDSAGVSVTYVAMPVISSLTLTDEGILIKWDAVKNATGYRVYRKAPGGSWEKVEDVKKVTSCVDTGFEEGVIYTYTIRAKVGSSLSTYISAGPQIIKIPEPVISSAENKFEGVELTWKAADNAEKYVVYRKTESGKWTKLATTSKTKYTDKKAVSGTKYYYSIAAVIGEETGNYGNNKLDIVYVQAPVLTGAVSADGGISVSWEAVKGASNYKIYRKVPGGSWAKLADTSATSYVDTSAAFGEEYIYTVRAKIGSTYGWYDAAGVSEVYIGTVNVTDAANRTEGIKLSWEGSEKVDAYFVYRRTDGESSWEKIAEISESGYVDENVINGTKYYYAVSPVMGELVGNHDAVGVSVTRAEDPKLVSAEETDLCITVKWEAVEGSTKYYVYRKFGGSSWKKIAIVTDLEYVDEDITIDTDYTYTVRAYVGGSASYYSSKGVKGVVTEEDVEDYARKKVEELGNDLKKAFLWVSNCTYKKLGGGLDVPQYARNIFVTKIGSCYEMASSFYYFAKVLGYDVHVVGGVVPLAIGGYGPHYWTEIDIDEKTYVCDAQFENQYKHAMNGYMIQYGQKNTWRYTDYSRVN